MEQQVRDFEALESAVGERPLGSMLKTIHHLDDHCRTILERSATAAVAIAPPSGPIDMRLIGGDVGFATIDDPKLLDLGADLPHGPAGLLFFTAGWRETLRVNGRIGSGGALAVDEAFVHCGKAMIRSQFWDGYDTADVTDEETHDGPTLEDEHRAFLAQARMAIVGSCDSAAAADVSPKGDHAGFIRVLDDKTVAIPNRPGNRRTDTFHNLVERDDVAVLSIAPGDDRVLKIQGRARLQTDDELLASMAVNDNAPTIALVIDVESASLEYDDVLAASQMWNPAAHIPAGELPKATKVWTDHVKMDETPGEEAERIREFINEDVMDTGISQDYEQNLY